MVYLSCCCVLLGGHGGSGERAEDGGGQRQESDGRCCSPRRGAASRTRACRTDWETSTSTRVSGEVFTRVLLMTTMTMTITMTTMMITMIIVWRWLQWRQLRWWWWYMITMMMTMMLMTECYHTESNKVISDSMSLLTSQSAGCGTKTIFAGWDHSAAIAHRETHDLRSDVNQTYLHSFSTASSRRTWPSHNPFYFGSAHANIVIL